MKRNLRYFLFGVIFLFLFLFLSSKALATTVLTPSIEEVNQQGSRLSLPLITGLTEAGTRVSVFLDDEYFGDATVNSEGTETDNFYYQFKKLIAVGNHVVGVVSQKGNFVSEKKEFNIKIGELFPPTLIAPSRNSIVGNPKPFITGLSKSGTLVHVFIDGVYNGKTEFIYNKSGTADFAYKPFLNLTIGAHQVWVVAEDESGRKSNKSNTLDFYVSPQTPSPSLVRVLSDQENTDQQPLIIGLTKRDLKIRVYIDEKINGEFEVEGEKDVLSFAYKPFVPLRIGKHSVYLSSVDRYGKESPWSNVTYFEIKRRVTIVKDEIKAIQPISFATSSLEKNSEIIVKSDEYVESTTSNQKIEEPTKDSQLVDNILASNKSEKNIDKTNQNLTVFILFLCAVIAWIFWVNRELIREKKEEQEGATGEKKIIDKN